MRLLSCLAVLALLACTGGERPILIGLAGPFSDDVGAPMRRAAELAVEEINAAGGVGGRPIELVARDDFGDTDSAVAVANQLVDAGVVAVVGHVYSGTTLASAPVYNAAGITQISPSSSSPDVTYAGDYTFRVCPSDLQQGASLARFAAERLGLRRGTILYLNDEYGRGIRATFAREFAQLGGTIDAADPYLGDRPEVGPFLERLAKRNTSQFIFVGGNRAEAEVVLRVARARGIRVPVLGGDALEGLEQAGDIAEGTYISNAYLASFDTPKNRAFVEAYQKKYPTALPPNQPAAATYDALYMLKGILERTGTSPAAIRDAVAKVGREAPAYSGVTGEIAFDEQGDVPRQRVVIGQVQNGQVVAVEGL
jgi:branched-chain amino acid transport system substrate-binding protein